MENQIKNNMDHPEELERLYRENKKEFQTAFFKTYPEFSDKKLAEFWKIRLNAETQTAPLQKTVKKDILFLLVCCLISGFLIKFPAIFGLEAEKMLFYEKNAGWIVFLGLSVFSFLTDKTFRRKQILFSVGFFALTAVYINLLPSAKESDSLLLACIHLPLMFWCLYGLIYIHFDAKNRSKRMDYIRYNGDLAVLGSIILMAGMILTGITLNLFSAIGVDIEKFYTEYIVMIGLVSAPVVATYIIRHYPTVTARIAPIIANIFCPLVLITLLVYLFSIPFVGKNPYHDRDFLLVFNFLLLGVMAIIIFSVSEISTHKKWNALTLFMLSIVTLIIDLLALSAILYRLGEFGFTPNRTAVLGSNLLIFGNLILITIDLYKVTFKKSEIRNVERTIAGYLPFYALWTLLVVFGFPLIFGFR